MAKGREPEGKGFVTGIRYKQPRDKPGGGLLVAFCGSSFVAASGVCRNKEGGSLSTLPLTTRCVFLCILSTCVCIVLTF